MNERSLTAVLSELSTLGTLPAAAQDRAVDCVADTLACIVAGRAASTSRHVLAQCLAEGGAPMASLPGLAERLPVSAAALVNGTAAHALDFDDISTHMLGHPSAVVLPAVLAVAEARRSSGGQLLEAFVAGHQAAALLGQWLNPAHFHRGWHATATIGTLAAALGVANLVKLPPQQTRHALATAASQAGGLQRNFGTDVKPLHVGLAARTGVLSSLLAERGFTGGSDILDGRLGFLDVYAGAERQAMPEAAPDLALMSGIQLKRHACCGAAHNAIDAVLELRTAHAALADARNIGSVRCDVNAVVGSLLRFSRPASPSQARFSLQFAIASAIIHGDCSALRYQDATLQDPELQSLMSRVQLVVDPAISTDEAGLAPARVCVTTVEGLSFSTVVREAVGSPSRPLDRREIRKKFLSSTESASFDGNMLLEAIWALPSCPDVSELAAKWQPHASPT